MGDVANPELEAAESIFRSLVWDNVVTAGLAALFAAAPWLAMPPLEQVVTFIVDRFTDKLYEIMKLTLDLSVIAFVNAEHQRAFEAAELQLMVLAQDAGIDSDAFKKAREDAKQALSQFIRFGGATALGLRYRSQYLRLLRRRAA